MLVGRSGKTGPSSSNPNNNGSQSQNQDPAKKSEMESDPTMKPIITNIGNEYFLVGRGSSLVLFKYALSDQAKLSITKLDMQVMGGDKKIAEIGICPTKYADQPIIPIAIRFHNGLSLLYAEI